ncbi:hypothetical protein BJP25_08500 [Actinokineospora bangkokensis]|uniref:Uncharacterized protein n=1 Tax=Actinokineospora bangkokensis TaxID=1193682 RepID=A0A1Q9LSY9_9PSEU|nr:hypothetical protein BJP25_08500 [Actinokineospora bangkokensis]
MVLVGLPFAGQDRAGALDAALMGAARDSSRALPGVVVPLTYATHPLAILAMVLCVAAVALRLRRPRAALLVVAAPVVTAGVNTAVLKPLFDRTHNGYLAYPSGHTGTLVAVLTAVVVIAVSAAEHRGRTALRMGLAAAGLTAVAAAGIVGHDYHYPTDCLGAAFWAIGTVVTIAAALDRFPATVRPVGDARSGAPRSGNAAA